MSGQTRRPGLSMLVFVAGTFTLGLYFTFASIQGDYGLLRRLEIEAETEALRARRAELAAEVEDLRNKTRRLSGEYLDLDLLDEQARDILGYVRHDEIVLD